MKSFEEKIKEAVAQHQVEYNPNHWNAIEKSLPKQASPAKYFTAGAVIIAAAGALWFLTNNEPTTPKGEPKAKQNIAVPVEVDKKEALSEELNQDKESMVGASENEVTEAKEKEQEDNIAMEAVKEELVKEEVLEPVEKSPFNVSLKRIKERVCANEPIKFGLVTEVPCTYSWSFGDGTFSDTPEPIHAYSKQGEYPVRVTLTSLLDGSKERVEVSKGVRVYPKPVAIFDFETLPVERFEQRIELNAKGENISKVKWEIVNQTVLGKTAYVALNKEGVYPAKIIVWNNHHCSDTVMKSVTVNNSYNLFAPTGFTPDGNGVNEDFLPKALQSLEGDFTFVMKVIDPLTGQLVFQTDDKNKPWRGENLSTGTKAQAKTYAWVVTLTLEGNEKRIFKGDITLKQ